MLGNEALIIDYKSGAIGSNYGQKAWLRENLIQLGLYVLAYRAAGGSEEVVGALYQPVSKVRSNEFKPRGAIVKGIDDDRTDISGRHDRVDPELFPDIVEQARAAAVAALAAIRAGQLEPPKPEKCAFGRAGGCSFPSICRRIC